MTASVHVAPAAAAPHGRWRALIRAFNTNKTSWAGLVLLVAIVFMAIIAPWLTSHDPIVQDVMAQLRGPSAEHIAGTDEYGRDIWARLLHGARISLVIGIKSTAIAMVVGSLIGLLAGW